VLSKLLNDNLSNNLTITTWFLNMVLKYYEASQYDNYYWHEQSPY